MKLHSKIWIFVVALTMVIQVTTHTHADPTYIFRMKSGVITSGATDPDEENNTMSIANSGNMSGTTGKSYALTFTADGGSGNYSYSLFSGTLPPGLTLTEGKIAGTPTTEGTWPNISVQASDGDGATVRSVPIDIRIYRPMTVAWASDVLIHHGSFEPVLPAAVGESFSAKLDISGGDGNYTYNISGGPLPSGLTFANGEITGTPTTEGLSKWFTITVDDGSGNRVRTEIFDIGVAAAPLSIVGLFPVDTVFSYNLRIDASGGTTPLQWSIASGTLPPGFILKNSLANHGGEISGVTYTLAPGVWDNIIVRVTDAFGRTADSEPFSITKE